MDEHVSLSTLREHFKNVYLLKDDQVELMLRSSSTSLNNVFKKVEDAFSSEVDRKTVEHLAHNLKGLLRNMGETQSARRAEQIETLAREGRDCDYRKEFDVLAGALEEIRNYKG